MAFLDEITIHAQAGKGGDGVVRWRREKFIARGGPNGGDGGRGGDIIVCAVRSLRVLDQYRSKKEFEAKHGEDGMSRSFKGANGDDLIIDFPVGSKITNIATNESLELVKEGQEVTLLRGGAGGYGNEHFKSSTNQAPKEATPGKAGEEGDFFIEISLIADIGLIGFPNAGKSSLLNGITNADAKVGAYAFTTIDPNLGDLHGFIIADIPGLIEGASVGKGLGYKFLRHITKTRLLAHLVSLEQHDPLAAYHTVRNELASYGNGLSDKEEIVVLTKTDVTTAEHIAATTEQFAALGITVFTLSLFDDVSTKKFSDDLVHLLRAKEVLIPLPEGDSIAE